MRSFRQNFFQFFCDGLERVKSCCSYIVHFPSQFSIVTVFFESFLSEKRFDIPHIDPCLLKKFPSALIFNNF